MGARSSTIPRARPSEGRRLTRRPLGGTRHVGRDGHTHAAGPARAWRGWGGRSRRSWLRDRRGRRSHAGVVHTRVRDGPRSGQVLRPRSRPSPGPPRLPREGPARSRAITAHARARSVRRIGDHARHNGGTRVIGRRRSTSLRHCRAVPEPNRDPLARASRLGLDHARGAAPRAPMSCAHSRPHRHMPSIGSPTFGPPRPRSRRWLRPLRRSDDGPCALARHTSTHLARVRPGAPPIPGTLGRTSQRAQPRRRPRLQTQRVRSTTDAPVRARLGYGMPAEPRSRDHGGSAARAGSNSFGIPR